MRFPSSRWHDGSATVVIRMLTREVKKHGEFRIGIELSILAFLMATNMVLPCITYVNLLQCEA